MPRTRHAVTTALIAFAAQPVVAAQPSGRTTPTQSPTQAPTQYMTLPIHGEIGHDALAAGVEDALTWARLRKIEHVLIHIDSSGGDPNETERILELLSLPLHDDQFTYSARVDEATGEAALIMLACDKIFVEEGAIAGAALTRRRSEAKPSWTARIVARAEARGHSPVLAAAMCDPAARVYVSYDQDGEVTALSDHRPITENAAHVDQIDDGATLLALTADQAVETGLADWWHRRTIFESDTWDERQTYGAAAMRRAHRDHLAALDRARRAREQLERDQDNVQAWASQLPSLIRIAEDKDPWNYRDYRIDPETELLTEQSRLAWRRRTDDAIRAWSRVRAGIQTIYKVMRRHTKDDFPADLVLEVRTIDAHAEETILRLRTERGRTK
jgi:hypothetical protein